MKILIVKVQCVQFTCFRHVNDTHLINVSEFKSYLVKPENLLDISTIVHWLQKLFVLISYHVPLIQAPQFNKGLLR